MDNNSIVSQQRPPAQLELIASSEMPASFFSETESNGVFTGERLLAQRPEKYAAIISLTAEGLGAILIGSILHVSPNTVLAVRRREAEAIDIDRQRLAVAAMGVARMCIEAIEERLADDALRAQIPVRDLGILVGIMADKSELLSGRATQRLEEIAPHADHDDYLRWIGQGAAKRARKEGSIDAVIVHDQVPAVVHDPATTDTDRTLVADAADPDLQPTLTGPDPHQDEDEIDVA